MNRIALFVPLVIFVGLSLVLLLGLDITHMMDALENGALRDLVTLLARCRMSICSVA